LAIAKEIIERLGGTLIMENRRPRGLKQTIILTARNKAGCRFTRETTGFLSERRN
jgi:hypothetical protein